MDRFRIGVTIFAAVLLLGVLVGVAGADGEVVSGSDVYVFVEGGVVEIEDSTATIWASESVTVWLGPTDDRAGEHYIYCLDIDESEVGCEQGTLERDEGFSFEFSSNEFSTGRYQFTARIHEDDLGFDNPLIEEVSFTFVVLSKEGDVDNDGLSNQREIRLGTDYRTADTDGDGLDDGAEVNRHDTDPLDDDSDGDGLSDGEEVDRYRTDPTVQDTDDDGLDDGEEVNEYGTNPQSAHTDGDGLSDGVEVDEYGTNPTKTDTDGDGFDDGVEVEQGSDPTDPDSIPEESNEESQVQQQEDSNDRQSSDTGEPDPTIQSSEENKDVQRGFFTNGPDSSLPGINGALITTVGFVLSVIGILLEMRGG